MAKTKKVPKATLNDLNLFLFSQLERLDDPDLTPEQLEMEVKRSKSIGDISKRIISNASLSLSAKKYLDTYDVDRAPIPDMLQLGDSDGN